MNRTPSVGSRRPRQAAVWVLQIVLALAYLAAGWSKVSGAEAALQIFDQLGSGGDAFRILYGLAEIVTAVALLVPRISGLAALVLAALIVIAIAVHLALGELNGLVFLVPLALVTVVAWHRRTDNPLRRRAPDGYQ